MKAELPYSVDGVEHNTYYEWLRTQFINKRAILEKGLKMVGINAMPSEVSENLRRRYYRKEIFILFLFCQYKRVVTFSWVNYLSIKT